MGTTIHQRRNLYFICNKNKLKKDGLSSWCKECNNQYRANRKALGIKSKPRRHVTERKNGKKYCPKCKQWKNESEFGNSKNTRDGLNSWCRECDSEKGKNYRLNNEDYCHNYGKEYRQTLPDKYRCYKSNAATKKRKFGFSLFDFATIIVQPCYYCGKKDGIYNGVDRLDNNKGYVKSNCVSCCKSCNFQKHAYSEKQFNEDSARRHMHTLLKPFKNIKEPLSIIVKNYV